MALRSFGPVSAKWAKDGETETPRLRDSVGIARGPLLSVIKLTERRRRR